MTAPDPEAKHTFSLISLVILIIAIAAAISLICTTTQIINQANQTVEEKEKLGKPLAEEFCQKQNAELLQSFYLLYPQEYEILCINYATHTITTHRGIIHNQKIYEVENNGI